MSFDELWKNFKKEAFRLELLQEYNVQEEEKAIEKFLRGGKIKAQDFGNEWDEYLEGLLKRNVRAGRVHVVDLPLSDYIKFEFESYKFSQKWGEDIRIILREDYEKITDGKEFKDFWLFDDETVLEFDYDTSGRWLSGEIANEDIEKYVELKNKLLENSTKLNDFRI